MTKLIRPWAAVAVSSTLFVLLTACASAGSRVRLVNRSSVSISSGDATSWTEGGSWGSATTSVVSCNGQTCEVTLGGTGATVQVFGTTFVFDRVADGLAVVRVDDVPVSLRQGDATDQGAVHLVCSRVTATDVTLVVRPR